MTKNSLNLKRLKVISIQYKDQPPLPQLLRMKSHNASFVGLLKPVMIIHLSVAVNVLVASDSSITIVLNNGLMLRKTLSKEKTTHPYFGSHSNAKSARKPIL